MSRRLDINGKTIAITGGAGGIGVELGRAALARGAQVVLLDVDGQAAVRAAESLGGDTLGYRADVRDPAELTAAFADIAAACGGIDVLSVNAGVLPLAKTADAGDFSDHLRVIEINYLGAWNTLRAGAPYVLARRGHIVFTSSVLAFAANPLNAAYASSKAAVEMLARVSRAELAPAGVTVGVAHFGAVGTAMVRAFEADELSSRILTLSPPGVLTEVTPAAAADALIRGIERRAPRTIYPARWKVLYALRGIAGPITDAYFLRSRKAQRLVTDTRAREAAERTRDLQPFESLT
jgi:NAD(P)-dependent dehydrogenase (short-subunit alcohol dehydrogenase family)